MQDTLDDFFGMNGEQNKFSVHRMMRFFMTPRRTAWLIHSCYRPSVELVKGGEVLGFKGQSAAIAKLTKMLGDMEIGKVQELLAEIIPFFLTRYMSLSGFLPSTTIDLHAFSQQLLSGKSAVESLMTNAFGLPKGSLDHSSMSASAAGTNVSSYPSETESNSTSNSTNEPDTSNGEQSADTPSHSSPKQAASD